MRPGTPPLTGMDGKREPRDGSIAYVFSLLRVQWKFSLHLVGIGEVKIRVLILQETTCIRVQRIMSPNVSNDQEMIQRR